MIKAKQKQSGWLRRRKLAIIAGILAVAMLLIAFSYVLDYLRIYTYEDPADGTKYYIRNDIGIYAIYQKGKKGNDHLPLSELAQDCYVTPTGTVVEVKPDTGESSTRALVDMPENGEVDYNLSSKASLLMFKSVPRANIVSIEVHNSNGSYSFSRYDENLKTTNSTEGSLLMDNATWVPLDQEAFSGLYNAVAISNFRRKLMFEAGEQEKFGKQIQIGGESYWVYPEYGLAEEIRVDEDGNEYHYSPDYFILVEESTDESGQKVRRQHKVVVGDPLLSGNGYYAQYYSYDNEKGTFLPRETVYVINASEGEIMKQGPGELITPLLSYHMTANSYYRVQNLILAKRNSTGLSEIINASYIPIEDRLGTVDSNRAFVFHGMLKDLIPSSTEIEAAMKNIYAPTVLGVKEFQPDLATLAEYGLYRVITDEEGNPILTEKGELDYEEASAYHMMFDYTASTGEDAESTEDDTIYQSHILISEKNKDGNYYAYSFYYCIQGEDKSKIPVIYPWISEVAGTTFNFLQLDRFDWTDEYFIQTNMAFCEEISIKTPSYNALFRLDNSQTKQDGSIRTDRLTVSATDSKGREKNTFSGLYGLHTKQNINGASYDIYWDVDVTEISAYDSAGNSYTINDFYYENNIQGVQVTCLKKPIATVDGRQIYVTANTIREVKNDVVTEYPRYDTANFKYLYSHFTASTLMGSYDLSAEQEAALIGNPDNLLMELTFKEFELKEDGTKEYRTYAFCFYSLGSLGSSRKVYLTINGVGGFYVNRSNMEGFVRYAELFFEDQYVEPSWD